MEVTVLASEIKQDITLPMRLEESIPQTKSTIDAVLGTTNQIIENYRLLQCLNANPNSEVWLAADQFNGSVAVKLSKRMINLDMYERIAKIKNDNLVPILAYGMVGEYAYEIMPYYKNGTLIGKLDEELIRSVVLPSIVSALKDLHGNNLVHNDIKPENLLWNEEKNEVLLGDYGCVTEIGVQPNGFSLSYVAPELLLGNPAKVSSDWASVGLTLGTLVSGEKIINVETKSAALKWWEKSFVFCNGSNAVNQLINGMIQKDIKRRLGPKAANSWINKNAFSAESRVRHRTDSAAQKQVLVFENPRFLVDNVESLLLAAEHYWEHLVFLMERGKVENFLRSIDEKYYRYYLSLKKEYGVEQTLFMMTYYLSANQYFIWRGMKYHSLVELEQTWDYQPDMVRDFLLNGSVEHVLKTEGAESEVLDYIKELVNIGRLNPEKACQLLFLALHGEDEFIWEGTTYYTIEQLIDDICSVPDVIDSTVKNLLESSRFQAWMTFLGYGDFVEKILRRCR